MVGRTRFLTLLSAALYLAVAAGSLGVEGVRPGDSADFVAAVLLYLLTWALARLKVPLPAAGSVSLHFFGALTAALILPPFWASLVAALSLPFSPPFLRDIFNRSQVGLSALLAAWASPYPLLPLVVYLGVNLSAMLLMAWVSGHAPAAFFRKNLRPYLLGYWLIAPLSYVGAVLWERPDWELAPAGVLLLLSPALLLYLSWRDRTALLTATERVLISLARILEARDAYTARHSERVAEIADALGQALGLRPEERDRLRLAALLHDIGKVGTPDRILQGHGKLGEEERELVREHPVISAEILKPLEEYLGPVVPAILYHHERWDGSGYPRGLKGTEIPLMARILAVADVYEALTSDRPYRRALSPEEALAIMKNGGELDPKVVEVLENLLRREPCWKCPKETRDLV